MWAEVHTKKEFSVIRIHRLC